MLLLSCSSLQPKYPENQIEFKIFRFRENHSGLTNRFCVQWDSKNECQKYEVKEYDLGNSETRDTLRKLNFICKIGGKRYKIDSETPRLRRDTKYKCGLFKMKRCWKSEFVEIQPAKLRDLNTRCFSANRYGFDQI